VSVSLGRETIEVKGAEQAPFHGFSAIAFDPPRLGTEFRPQRTC
jgi:hypothetical protein